MPDLFAATRHPSVHGLPCGVDFAARVADGIAAACPADDPFAIARIEVWVNTARMGRRIEDRLSTRAGLLPRIRLLGHLAAHPQAAVGPPPAPPLARRLELTRLMRAALEARPELGPRTSAFALAGSLSALMDEAGEIELDWGALADLDLSDQAGLYETTRTLLGIAAPLADPALRRPAEAAEALAGAWAEAPPEHPVIVAGTTASRAPTLTFLRAVAGLPRGHVILPGFDADLPTDVWHGLDDAMTAEDHPQYRFKCLLDALDLDASDVTPWDDAPAPAPARNRVISLALRPAPVTDRWLAEGPDLPPLPAAMQDVTLIEAPDRRQEAAAIALGLRHAIEGGGTAALVTPDRVLSRQVAAHLARWDVVPDDSAGQPLHLSPAGRLIRQAAEALGRPLTSDALIALLKHPAVASGGDRNLHLLRTREAEVQIRRAGLAFPTVDDLCAVAAKAPREDPGRDDWCAWLHGILDPLAAAGTAHLSVHAAAVHSATLALCAGQGGDAGHLSRLADWRALTDAVEALTAQAPAEMDTTPDELREILTGLLAEGAVRAPDLAHPAVSIWGTLEARAGTADLVVLGGLSEGLWPAAGRPDPWLNRTLRHRLGLTLPERATGLSAHDFQQAAGAATVWLTRAARPEDAPAVASRWLQRLTNLLDGLPTRDGPEALAQMRARGARWMSAARALEQAEPSEKATRPSPRPPVAQRPNKLRVTQFGTLSRDPFHIYATEILALRELGPLTPAANAAMRGTIWHQVMERMVGDGIDPAAPDTAARLQALHDSLVEDRCPWPVARTLWSARFAAALPDILAAEVARRDVARPHADRVEATFTLQVDPQFRVTGKIDRIDLTPDGRAVIYDYKSGAVPSAKQETAFDRQLLICAAAVSRGVVGQIGALTVSAATYVPLKPGTPPVLADLDATPPERAFADLQALAERWRDPARGYTARMAAKGEGWSSDIDHLSRYGEWGLDDAAVPKDMP
ncbi:MAG: double-strand break repair protein AddB [Paracoccaceae bacterium]